MASRTLSSSLLRAITARNHLPFLKIFSNFVHFCPNFQILCPFFNTFLPFFWKIACMPLLSRTDPGYQINCFIKCIKVQTKYFLPKRSYLLVKSQFWFVKTSYNRLHFMNCGYSWYYQRKSCFELLGIFYFVKDMETNYGSVFIIFSNDSIIFHSFQLGQ